MAHTCDQQIRKPRQEDCKIEASLGKLGRTCPKIKIKRDRMQLNGRVLMGSIPTTT